MYWKSRASKSGGISLSSVFFFFWFLRFFLSLFFLFPFFFLSISFLFLFYFFLFSLISIFFHLSHFVFVITVFSLFRFSCLYFNHLPALLLSESYFASFVFNPSLFTFALNIFHARAFLIYLNSPHFLLSLFLSVKCLSRFTHLLSSGSFCWLASLSHTFWFARHPCIANLDSRPQTDRASAESSFLQIPRNNRRLLLVLHRQF